MREAFRQNKQLLINIETQSFQGLDIILVYQGLKVEDFNIISNCIKELLKKLSIKSRKS